MVDYLGLEAWMVYFGTGCWIYFSYLGYKRMKSKTQNKPCKCSGMITINDVKSTTGAGRRYEEKR